MRRLLNVVYIVFCLELGVFLFIFPWTSLWNKNFFVSHYPVFAGVARNYFVRGGVSGMGLADVWLALFEAWRFRRDLGIVSSRPNR